MDTVKRRLPGAERKMPVHYNVEESRALVVTVASGTVTVEDFRALRRKMHGDERVPGLSHLVDLRAVSEFAIPGFSVRELAREPVHSPDEDPGPMIAIVVNSEVGYGLARTYELTLGPAGGQVEVFDRIEEAEAWLAGGLD
jgi:hypothetical protein